jgi:hypothetical protein
MEIIILGSHRSGTSLTASIVQALGVHIGDNLLGTHPSQKKGHFEDIEFYELNMAILKSAGGNWANPPARQKILSVQSRFEKRISWLIDQKSRRDKWGWKDPRTCLTIPLYLPYLRNPHFILVYRDMDMICSSLARRSGKNRDRWKSIVETYQKSMEQSTVGYPIFRLQFESLVNRYLVKKELEYINSFVGGNGQIESATNLIDFRI